MSLPATFELFRLTFLQGYLQYPEKYPDALAFAYDNRISPILHEDIRRESYDEDPFEEAYSVKADFVTSVLKRIDELWGAEDFDALAFYSLEDHYGGRGVRVDLVHCIEYFRIDGTFDDAVYRAIEANAPMEANQLASTFSPDEVDFY